MINYVEFPARDLSATQAFFEQVFGWQFESYGPDYIAFSSAGTPGGFYRSDKASRMANGAALAVIQADDLEAKLEVLFLQNINIIQARDHPLDWQRHGARMSLCLVNNVSYGKHMDSLIKQSYFSALYRTNGASQCAQMLATGRADIWVNNEYGARVIIQRLRLEQKLLIHQPAVQSTPSYIAFSKKRQLSAIRDRFDRALKKMKQDGRYQQLIDQAASEAGLLSHDTLLH